jgi:hypothetical protein
LSTALSMAHCIRRDDQEYGCTGSNIESPIGER